MIKKSLIVALIALANFSPSLAADTEKAAENEKPEKTAAQLPRADPPLFVHFSPKCQISDVGSTESPFALLLLGTILKPVIETAIPAATGWLYDKGVQALEKHNAKQTSSSTITTTTTFYNVNDKKFQFGCLTLVRAKRGLVIDKSNYTKKERDGSFTIPSGSDWELNTNTESRLKALGISRAPEFYMEIAFSSIVGQLETDEDVLALLAKKEAADKKAKAKPKTGSRSMYRKVTPAYLTYLSSGAEKVNGGEKHVSVELHMDMMDEKGGWQPFYSKTYDLGRIKVGSEKINLTSLGDDTFAPPPMRITEDGYRDPIPVRVTAVLTETDDNIDLARTLETAFKDEQTKKSTVDAVAKAVVDKLQTKIDEKTGAQALPAAPAKK
jgi:hypothetical protein